MADLPLDGVTFLDHTADVGIDVAAPSLPLLYHRAALGMLALLRGHDDARESAASGGAAASGGSGGSGASGASGGSGGSGGSGAERRVSGTGRDPAGTLAAWLREVHFLHEVEGRDYVAGAFDRLDDTGFEAAVRTVPAAPAVREIKGVTYHDLHVRRTAGGWTGRVIFDV